VAANLEITGLSNGTEIRHILGEVIRWADAADGVAWSQDGIKLELGFSKASPGEARRMVEDTLALANSSWPIHLRLEDA
jgi:hypothetical protein